MALALIIGACTPGDGVNPSAQRRLSEPVSSPAASLPTITVGSAASPESAVVAELYAQALERAGFTVERAVDLGSRDVTLPALVDGEADLVPEYIGRLLADRYEAEPTSDVDQSLARLNEALEADGLVAFEPTRGANARGFAVRQETADQHGLTSMSDLAEVATELRWGVGRKCEDNGACGRGLDEVYGIDLDDLEVETRRACSTGIAEALNAGNIDVAQVCTTQPELVAFNLVLLEDDRGLAAAQNIVPVVRQEIVDRAGDRLGETLNAVTQLLTTEELRHLRHAVVVNGESYEEAARQWIEDHGL